MCGGTSCEKKNVISKCCTCPERNLISAIVLFNINNNTKFCLLIKHVRSVGECDKSTCAEVPTHYDELGCKAVIEEGQCCPQKYGLHFYLSYIKLS